MNLTQFRPAAQPGPAAPTAATITTLNPDEGLGAFGSETEPVPAPASAPATTETEHAKAPAGLRLRIAPGMVLPLAIAAAIGATGGAAVLRAYQQIMLGRTNGSVRIETSTPGVDVSVAGKVVGRTPLSLSLAPGAHQVILAGEGARRELTLDVVSGATLIRSVEMPAATTHAAAVGSLHVQTDPAKQTVFVDGTERGVSPITVQGLAPGEHQVAVRADGVTVRRTVTVQANENTVLVLSAIERAPAAAPAPAAASGGWISVAAPFELKIREGGKLLGSTDADRLMLPAGEHALEFSNDALGFQTKRTVKIDAAKTAALKIEAPNGVMSINAQPWAEVWVDGQRIGETPIGKIATPIGQHEVVLRHPELGERRQIVTVTMRQPSRLGVDMRKK
jgi:hypothetical protein